MHFNKPIFLSKLTSLPEVGGDVAYYFDSFKSESMQRVFQNGMSDYNGKKSHDYISKHAEQFTWKKAALAYQNLYESL